MTPRLLLEPAAEAEYLAAVEWYAQRSPQVARLFQSNITFTLQAIEASPALFPVALGDIRKARVPQFPYMIYYVPLESVTTVIAVFHGRRDPTRWQERR